MNKIQNILKFAMRMEKDAGDFYSYYMDKVQSETAKKLFSELATIEMHHFNVLKTKFDQMGFSEPPITISWVVDDSFAAKDPSVISANSDIVDEAGGDTPDLTVIRMAYLMENDFALFYKNAADAVEDKEAKKFLKELEAWEITHRDMFSKRYQELLKKHWGDVASIIFA